jgi:gas vesicle protein
VTEKSEAIAAAIVGAVVGGVAGYMFFTPRGRALRRQIEPVIEDMARELAQFRGTLNRAMGVANEGWKVLNEALGENTAQARYSSPHQSTPF